MTSTETLASEPIVALEAEMIQCRDLVNTRHLPTDDEHSKRFFELLEKIAKSPSANVPDLAARLRTLEHVLKEWGDDFDGYKDFAQNVREDAERLAGAHPSLPAAESVNTDDGRVPIGVPGIFTTEDLNLVMDKKINLDAPDDDEILRVARLWLKEYAKAQVIYDAITKGGAHRDESEVFGAANGLHRAVLHMKASTRAGLAAQLKLLRWEMATMYAKRCDDGWEWEGGMYEDWDWSLRQMIASVRVVGE